MKKINVGLIGFGTVGQGVVKALLSKKKSLAEKCGVSIELVKIADKDLRARRGIKLPRRLLTKDINAVIKDKSIDIVAELIGGIHPAREIIMKSLSLGKHVVTANKALLAEYGREIFMLASRFRSRVGFEASVGGGIPIIDILRRSLVANDIEVIYGILNGTSNFILSRMSEVGCSFREALNEARDRGLAERNPKFDISGIDASHKLAILALLGFGLSVKPGDIFTEGIDSLDAMDIQYARNWGYAVKPLAIAKKAGKELDLRVHPTLIPARKLLANVKDENNAVFVKGDMIGEELFYGKGAGSLPTASSVVSDIIDIAGSVSVAAKSKYPFRVGFEGGLKKARKIQDLSTRYYVRFSAMDRPGVLAGISRALADNGISIATVAQKERRKSQPVPIVMLTHEANEGRMNRALARIDKMRFISKKSVKIRIER